MNFTFIESLKKPNFPLKPYFVGSRINHLYVSQTEDTLSFIYLGKNYTKDNFITLKNMP